MAQTNKKAIYTSPVQKFNGKPVKCDVWIISENDKYYTVTHIEGKKTGVQCLKEYITIV